MDLPSHFGWDAFHDPRTVDELAELFDKSTTASLREVRIGWKASADYHQKRVDAIDQVLARRHAPLTAP